VERSYVDGFASSDPHDLLSMLHTWRTCSFHSDRTDEALATLGASTKVMWMPCNNDRYEQCVCVCVCVCIHQRIKCSLFEANHSLLTCHAANFVVQRYFPVEDVSAESSASGPTSVMRVINDPTGHRAGDPHRVGQEAAAAAIAAHLAELLAMCGTPVNFYR
jgi:hypothetical protein